MLTISQIIGGNANPIAWQRIYGSREQRQLLSLGMFLVEWPNYLSINPDSREPCLDPDLENWPYTLYPMYVLSDCI